ncbi:MAG: hypothetical protein Fur0039_01710 [Rhodocyclaceae bacterium]
MPRAGCVWGSEAGLHSRSEALIEAGLDERFRPSYRLTRPEQFAAVFAFRRSLSSAHFQLGYRPNGLAGARLGVVVPKKHAGLAVQRNLVKRICRASFRLRRRDLPKHDLVLRLTRNIGGLDRAVLKAEIDGLMARLCESSSSHLG